MKNKIFAFILLLLLFIAYIIYTSFNGNTTTDVRKIENIDGTKYEIIKHTTDTIYITKTHNSYIPGDSIYVETVIEKEIPIYTYMNVDTAEILKDYYSKYIYKDTLRLEGDMGYVSVIDTLSTNKIIGRNWKYDIRDKFLIETKIVKELPKNELYVGGMVSFNTSDFIHNISTGLLYKNKKNRIYQLNIGVTQLSKTYIGFGTYIKIGKK